MQPIAIAVFGVGRWGVHWVRNFLQHPGARVVAVVDPSVARLQELANRFSLGDDVKLLTDWADAIALPEVEAVAIVTPATTHYSLIRAALERGLHVLAEKPLTLEPSESLSLCQLAEQQQRQLVVDHTYLFHGAVDRGRQMVQSQELGSLRYGYATRTHLAPVRHDVDALWDLAIHDIAIFNHWLGETPIEVQAQGTVWLQPQSGDLKFFPQGLSDMAWVKLVYPSGFQAWIHLCWLNPDKQRRLCMVGSEGTLIFDELAVSPLMLQRGRLEPQDQGFMPAQQRMEEIAIAPVEPLRQVCDHFLNCIAQNSPSSVSSGWVGAQLVQVLFALTRSLNQGGIPVRVDQPGL